MTMEETKSVPENWKPVLIVFQEEDREEIIHVLAGQGIVAKARQREQKQINSVRLVTGQRRGGEEICVAAEDAGKAENIITPWMEKKKAERGQNRSALSFFTARDDSLKGKILTAVVIVAVILIYISRYFQ